MISLCCRTQRLLKCVWGPYIISASEQLQITSSLRHFWFYYRRVFFSVQGKRKAASVPTSVLESALPVFSKILAICYALNGGTVASTQI